MKRTLIVLLVGTCLIAGCANKEAVARENPEDTKRFKTILVEDTPYDSISIIEDSWTRRKYLLRTNTSLIDTMHGASKIRTSTMCELNESVKAAE